MLQKQRLYSSELNKNPAIQTWDLNYIEKGSVELIMWDNWEKTNKNLNCKIHVNDLASQLDIANELSAKLRHFCK